MLSRFFHVRSALNPFAVPAPEPTAPQGQGSGPAGSAGSRHADYDRHPLETRGFDHYVEWNEDNERFFVH